jgi:hypothetical protein
LRKQKSAIVANVSIALAFVTLVIDPKEIWHLEVRWLACTAVAFATISFSAISILWDLLLSDRAKVESFKPPRLLACYAIPRLVLVVEPTEALFDSALVSIFHSDTFGGAGTFEKLIGFGFVSNIQGNKMIQITPTHEFDDHAAVWDQIRQNDQRTLAGVLLKPSIPYNAVEAITIRNQAAQIGGPPENDG